jgi:hypothetical protein
VGEVAALPGDLAVQTSDLVTGFAAPLGAGASAGHPPLPVGEVGRKIA